MQVLTTVQGQAYNVFHGAPKGAMYEETIGATKDQSEDHLAAVYCSQAKTQTQDDGDSLQELATAIEQLAYRTFPALHEGYIHKGAGKVFVNNIRKQSLK
jgi:hypothetical protein